MINSDTSFQTTIPFAWPWTPGRSYSSNLYITSVAGTTTIGGTIFFTPFIIPNPIQILTIGCEVTGAATSGCLWRGGIYNADQFDGSPELLLIDGGTVTVDATGFRSITVNYQITYPGLYWICHVAERPATQPTFRSHSNSVRSDIFMWEQIGSFSNNNQMFFVRALNNFADYATYGLPKHALMSISTTGTAFSWDSGTVFPRVMLGV